MKRSSFFFALMILILGYVFPSSSIRAQLRLYSPNGNENLISGASTLIRWGGVSTSDTVSLDYTTDAGLTWNSIKSNATGVSYLWSPIPNVNSSNCLVRVSKGGVLSDSVLHLKPADNNRGGYVEFSPDEALALTSSDNDVHLYDALTGKELWKTSVYSLAPKGSSGTGIAHFTLNGTRIIVCIINELSGDTLHLLETSTGKELAHWGIGLKKPWQIPTLFDRILYAAVSPTNDTLIAISSFDTIRIFNISTQQQINVFGNANSTSGTIPFICWSPDGKMIASANAANANSSVRLIDAGNGNFISDFSPNANIISKVRFSNDGKTLAVVSYTDTNSTVDFWDIATGSYKDRIRTFRLYQDICFSPDDSRFLTTDSRTPPSFAQWWNSATRSPLSVLGTRDFLGDIDISEDGRRVLVGATTGAVIFQPPSFIAGQSDTSDNFFSIRMPIADTAILVSIDSITANTNQNISFNVRLQAGKNVDFTGVTGLQGKISFNTTLLEPIGTTPKGIISQYIQTIDWQYPVQGLTSPIDTVVSILPFRTGLGNDSVTSLSWSSVSAVPTPKVIETQNGFLRLADICKNGGARLIFTSPKTYLSVRAIDKSEHSFSVSFRTNEYGNTRIQLYNCLGIEIATFVNEALALGEHQLEMAMGLQSSGMYYVVMTTPTERYTVPVRVIK